MGDSFDDATTKGRRAVLISKTSGASRHATNRPKKPPIELNGLLETKVEDACASDAGSP
jgi:hypothetical protein